MKDPLPTSFAMLLCALAAGCAMGPAAPLTRQDCGWPADTKLAFEGWATEAALGFQQSDPSGRPRYWLISDEAVPFTTSRGEGSARGACSVSADGLHAFSVVADDWSPPASGP